MYRPIYFENPQGASVYLDSLYTFLPLHYSEQHTPFSLTRNFSQLSFCRRVVVVYEHNREGAATKANKSEQYYRAQHLEADKK